MQAGIRCWQAMQAGIEGIAGRHCREAGIAGRQLLQGRKALRGDRY